jgi:hypothetical protein
VLSRLTQEVAIGDQAIFDKNTSALATSHFYQIDPT